MPSNSTISIIAIQGFSEPFSSILHLIGVAVFLFLGIRMLIQHSGNAVQTAVVIIYVIAVIFTLSMSGVYHLLAPGAAKAVLQRLDHAGIFFLIAASFTPIQVYKFSGFLRWGLLLLVWAAAITGIVLKSVFFNDIPEWLSVTLYLSLGWTGAISAYILYRRMGFNYIKPLVYGAAAYSLGAVLEFARWPVLIPGVIGPHELFHIMVLIGIGTHWRFIYHVIKTTPGTQPLYSNMAVTPQ